MGSAAAVLLARHDDADLLVLDVDGGRAARVAERAGAEGRVFDANAGELAIVLKDVSAVAACFGARVFGTGDVLAASDAELRAVLAGVDGPALGRWLRRLHRSPMAPYRLRRIGREASGVLWALTIV